jgi:ADP-heptose:LPS heptosyltransferase
LDEATRLRVGLVWSGSKTLRRDQRSIAFADVLPLLTDETEWISLQKEVPSADSDLLSAQSHLRHFGDSLGDFADTAALVELMDLVVTVDTSVAHLAGAMGKPVWIMLPFNPFWIWLLDRQDSPWYPTARLFR